MKKVILTFILALLANNALATVCFETPNPCKDTESCEKVSDFVFDAEFQYVSDEKYVNEGNMGKNSTIATHKVADFEVVNWIKGKPLHDPTLIRDYVVEGDWFCVGIKPVDADKLEVGKKYRIYGYYHGSKNYAKIMGNDYGNGPRMEMRYYLKFEEIEAK